VTPLPAPTADATTSLVVVEYYKENLHTIVTSIQNARRIETRNKNATMTTTNRAMMAACCTTTMMTTPSPPISLEKQQQAQNDSSAENARKMQTRNKSATSRTTTKIAQQ
jgi:hypothetical protein